MMLNKNIKISNEKEDAEQNIEYLFPYTKAIRNERNVENKHSYNNVPSI